MDNPAAFPHVFQGALGSQRFDPGMTLRDYFASGVANGMAAFSGTQGAGYGPGEIAQRSYEIADAMLAERSKEQSNG